MKFVGLSFDHMHMGDLLRQVHELDGAQIVGIADENAGNAEKVQKAAENFGLDASQVFDFYERCLETTRPDIAILCPAIADHARLCELAASFGAHVLVEKPFAISLEHADRMIAATQKAGVKLAVNWPLAWYASHNTAHRLISESAIGEVIEVHYYDGNRGPMRHLADKVEVGEEEAARLKNESWFYQKAAGGGSLVDYIGYGVTLGTWFHGGRAPIEVTSTWNVPAGLEVDEHSITVARYATGLSKFETRWGTFTDPWMLQPQPKCGFVIVGSAGTIASYDYETTVRVQNAEKPEGFEVPVDELKSPGRNPIEHFVDVLQNGTALHGPLDPNICRIGQQIADAAYQSATEKRTVSLPL